MFTQTRIKLTVLLAVILIVLYGLLSMVAGTVVNSLTIGQVDRSLRVGAMGLLRHDSTLNESLREPPTDRNPNDHYSPHLAHSFFLVGIRSMTGNVLASNDKTLMQFVPFHVNPMGDASYMTWRDSSAGYRLRLITVPVSDSTGSVVGFLQMGIDISPQLQVLQKFWQVFLTVGIIGFLIALLAGYYVSGRALRPIYKSWVQQQRFVADASHELRTPLAIIQSNLDLALSHGEQTDVEVLEWVSNAKAEARRITRMTDDLLTLARTDGNETMLELVDVDLLQLAKSTHELFMPIAEDKGVDLVLDDQTAGRLIVKGDHSRLRQLLIILVDNALKYTPASGRVTIELIAQRHRALLRVADTGIGMTREEMTHAFDRFYRADQARKRESGGTGLGLSIAKWIVETHGGKISIQSVVGEGSAFTVVL